MPRQRVVTYQSPRGHTISLCPACVAQLTAEGWWPTDRVDGQEYATVSHGQHLGYCAKCEGDLDDHR
jgi:hypothetical protein